MLRVYLAAPFFSPQQLAEVEKIESMFEMTCTDELQLYSPRKMGIDFSKIPKSEHRRMAYEVLYRNVGAILTSDCVLAMRDWSDPGVMFEMGYAYRSKIPVVTFTCGHEEKINAMVATIGSLNLAAGCVPSFIRNCEAYFLGVGTKDEIFSPTTLGYSHEEYITAVTVTEE